MKTRLWDRMMVLALPLFMGCVISSSELLAYSDHVKMLTFEQEERLHDPKLSSRADLVFMSDGSVIEGKFDSLPPLHHPFGGAITLNPEDVAMIGFFRRGEDKRMAYVLHTGEVFVGRIPLDSLVFLKSVSGKKVDFKSANYSTLEVNPHEIDFIRLRPHHKKYRAHSGLFSVVLAGGDRFAARIETHSVTVGSATGDITYKLDQIVDLRVRQGGILGTLKSESVPVNLKWSPLKDAKIVMSLECNGERVIIPWGEVDRIAADRGALIKRDGYAIFDEMDQGMVYIPPGKFLFGASSVINAPDLNLKHLENDKPLSYTTIWQALLFLETFEAQEASTTYGPAVPVDVGSFYMDRYEVTNREYEKFVLATHRAKPAHWEDGIIPKGLEDHPVVNVGHNDASAYAAWCGKRLPTEIEWERAAKWQRGYLYSYGDQFDPNLSNVDNSNGTVPVGTFEKYGNSYTNKMPQDLNGNVAEWTSSIYIENYHEVLLGTEQPINPDPRFKVVKGGSFRGSSITSSSVFRGVMFGGDFNDFTGFRCVQDADPYTTFYERGK